MLIENYNLIKKYLDFDLQNTKNRELEWKFINTEKFLLQNENKFR